jgi:hypothetical protein
VCARGEGWGAACTCTTRTYTRSLRKAQVAHRYVSACAGGESRGSLTAPNRCTISGSLVTPWAVCGKNVCVWGGGGGAQRGVEGEKCKHCRGSRAHAHTEAETPECIRMPAVRTKLGRSHPTSVVARGTTR